VPDECVPFIWSTAGHWSPSRHRRSDTTRRVDLGRADNPRVRGDVMGPVSASSGTRLTRLVSQGPSRRQRPMTQGQPSSASPGRLLRVFEAHSPAERSDTELHGCVRCRSTRAERLRDHDPRGLPLRVQMHRDRRLRERSEGDVPGNGRGAYPRVRSATQALKARGRYSSRMRFTSVNPRLDLTKGASQCMHIGHLLLGAATPKRVSPSLS
jgi:hypothetical protein